MADDGDVLRSRRNSELKVWGHDRRHVSSILPGAMPELNRPVRCGDRAAHGSRPCRSLEQFEPIPPTVLARYPSRLVSPPPASGPGAQHVTARSPATGRRPLRPSIRARRLRRRHGRAPGQRAAPRRHRRGARRRSTTSSTAGPRAPTSAPATAPGILIQIPDAFLRGVLDVELPEPGPLRRRHVLPAPGPRPAGQARGADRAQRPRRGPERARLARRARSTRRRSATPPTPAGPYIRQLIIEAGPGFQSDQDAFERKLYVIRRIVELAAGPDFYASSFSSRTIVYKGMLDLQPARALLPRPARRALRQRAGARALALLDQHVPELGARPPLPRDLPQRRDQHADGQRQLDARARVAAVERAVRRRPPEGAADRAPGRLGLGDVRQRPRAADARRPLAAARGDDDDPRGLRRTATTCPTSSRASTPSTPASWSRGTARRRSASPTAASSARRSTATACAPAAGCETNDGYVCSARRPGCCRRTRRT